MLGQRIPTCTHARGCVFTFTCTLQKDPTQTHTQWWWESFTFRFKIDSIFKKIPVLGLIDVSTQVCTARESQMMAWRQSKVGIR